MKKEIKKFVEEITTNFSELFVETFLIRYLYEFNDEELLDIVKYAKKELNEKISNKMNSKLSTMGYEKTD